MFTPSLNCIVSILFRSIGGGNTILTHFPSFFVHQRATIGTISLKSKSVLIGGITFSDNGQKSRTDGRTHGQTDRRSPSLCPLPTLSAGTITETIVVHVDIPVTFIFLHYLDLIRRACRHFLTVKRCILQGTDYRSCKDPSWSVSTSEVVKGCFGRLFRYLRLATVFFSIYGEDLSRMSGAC